MSKCRGVPRKGSQMSSGRGVANLKKYRAGGRLTASASILAKCADCVGLFVDGKVDCECVECPLHPFMPYNHTTPRAKGRRGRFGKKAEEKEL